MQLCLSPSSLESPEILRRCLDEPRERNLADRPHVQLGRQDELGEDDGRRRGATKEDRRRVNVDDLLAHRRAICAYERKEIGKTKQNKAFDRRTILLKDGRIEKETGQETT